MMIRNSARGLSLWRLALAIGLGLVLGVGLLAVLRYLIRPLALVVLAIALAVAFEPLVDFLRRWLPRAVASVLVIMGLLLLIVGMTVLIIPPLIAQAQELASRLPNLVDLVQGWMAQLQIANQEQITSSLLSELGTLSTSLVTVPLRLFSSLLDVLLLVFIALYWLILIPSMKSFFLSLFSDDQQDRISKVLARMGMSMGGYFRGVAINGVIVGLLTYIGLLIIGVDYALVLGILAGLLEIVPIIGPLIAGVVIVVTALLQSTTTALISAIYILVMQQLESNILVPNIMRKQANISPLLVLVAVYAGGSLGGLLGALVAIPVAAVLNVFVTDVLAPAVRQTTGASEDAEIETEAGA